MRVGACGRRTDPGSLPHPSPGRGCRVCGCPRTDARSGLHRRTCAFGSLPSGGPGSGREDFPGDHQRNFRELRSLRLSDPERRGPRPSAGSLQNLWYPVGMERLSELYGSSFHPEAVNKRGLPLRAQHLAGQCFGIWEPPGDPDGSGTGAAAPARDAGTGSARAFERTSLCAGEVCIPGGDDRTCGDTARV